MMTKPVDFDSGKTMICLILDRSGSMAGRETDVVGGVNKFIAEQKVLPHPASIALVRFDSEAVERFRPMGDLQKCEPLADGEYKPRGMTPLLDAVGKTIVELDADWMREKPERAIVVIVTDGRENASSEYSKSAVKALIEARQASGKWAFIYLGANVDAFAEAGGLGIPMTNSANFVSSEKGTAAMYGAVSHTVSRMRASGSNVAENLGRDIGEDEDGSLPVGVGAAPVPAPQPAPGTTAAPDPNAVPVTTTVPKWEEPGKPWTPPA